MEGLTVGRAVSGDGHVAELARERRVREVARPEAKLVDPDPGDHDVVGAERRHLDAGDGVPGRDRSERRLVGRFRHGVIGRSRGGLDGSLR